ncbi:MAG: GTP 3',8-cyclase MoaA [Treponema sp.]|jgi:cyclic pyranopterin phosphate synthase|nr:GTP 3',8-cyclase MoaA [Treponema sp.]
MIDALGRKIEYLRLSLTDRCNLRCVYCRGASAGTEGAADAAGGLSPVHIERIVRGMVSLGITKVRLTGGEPLMRRDLEDIVKTVSSSDSVRDICMTTNGHGLARRARSLKKAGLMRVNISLDSLRSDRCREITGGGDVEQALAGIDAALDAGLLPVKVNCVMMKGVNDNEADEFIELARTKPLCVRFIELMPMGGARNDELRAANDLILRRHPELSPLSVSCADQSAVEYTAPGFLGAVGFISPVTRPFCGSCSRVRVTHDGRLRPCLGNDMETDLMPALSRNDDELLRSVIERAIFNKPQGSCFNSGYISQRRMNRIGG